MKFEFSKETKEALSALNLDFVYVPMSAKDIADIAKAYLTTEDELAAVGCRMVDKCVEVK